MTHMVWEWDYAHMGMRLSHAYSYFQGLLFQWLGRASPHSWSPPVHQKCARAWHYTRLIRATITCLAFSWFCAKHRSFYLHALPLLCPLLFCSPYTCEYSSLSSAAIPLASFWRVSPTIWHWMVVVANVLASKSSRRRGCSEAERGGEVAGVFTRALRQ